MHNNLHCIRRKQIRTFLFEKTFKFQKIYLKSVDNKSLWWSEKAFSLQYDENNGMIVVRGASSDIWHFYCCCCCCFHCWFYFYMKIWHANLFIWPFVCILACAVEWKLLPFNYAFSFEQQCDAVHVPTYSLHLSARHLNQRDHRNILTNHFQ